MEKRRLVEMYAVLLILCTALLIFGMTQMQLFLSGILTGQEITTANTIITSVQASSLGLVLCALIIMLFLRRFWKKRFAQKAQATA